MTRKKITLPSGGTVVVRCLTANDFASLIGDIPTLYADPKAPAENEAPTQKQIQAGIKMARVVLLSCCSPITYPDGSRKKIVEKELDLLADNETTIGEISDDDAKAIIQTAGELTNMGKEAAGVARTFPAEQETAGPAGPAGEALPKAADRPAEASA